MFRQAFADIAWVCGLILMALVGAGIYFLFYAFLSMINLSRSPSEWGIVSLVVLIIFTIAPIALFFSNPAKFAAYFKRTKIDNKIE